MLKTCLFIKYFKPEDALPEKVFQSAFNISLNICYKMGTPSDAAVTEKMSLFCHKLRGATTYENKCATLGITYKKNK